MGGYTAKRMLLIDTIAHELKTPIDINIKNTLYHQSFGHVTPTWIPTYLK